MDPYMFLYYTHTHTHTHTHIEREKESREQREHMYDLNVRKLFNRETYLGGVNKRKTGVQGNPVGLILKWSQNACIFKRMDEIRDAIDKNVRSMSRH
jgi:hypothetical protein